MALGTSLGDLFFRIVADTVAFDKSVDGTKKKSEGLETAFKSVGSEVKKLVGAGSLILLAKKIADVGIASIKSASDAQETQNKFDVVFSGISSYANDMAVSLAGSYGTSIQGAKDMLAGTGDLLTGLGFTQESAFDLSQQVLRLGADLASFTNYSGGAEGASTALTKALLGEREQLKGLGISINEADLKAQVLLESQQGLTFETEKQAKANATLSLVYSQTLNAQDDFARSQDSFANTLKVARARTSDLQVELGRALLPTATKGIGIFSELTGKLGAYIKSLNDVKEAEKAQASGKSTKEQEVFLIETKITALKKEIENQQKSLLIEDSRVKINKELVKADIIRRQSVLTSLSLTLDGLKTQIKAESDLEEENRKTQQAIEDKAKAEEDAKVARQKAYVEQNEQVQKIIESNKTEIQIIDDKIAEITKLGLKEGKLQDDQLKAVKILQDEKEKISSDAQKLKDEEVKKTKDAEAEKTKVITDANKENSNNYKKSKLSNIEVLEFEKDEAIKNAKEQGLETANIILFYDDKIAQAKKQRNKEYVDATIDIANSILQITSNLATQQIDDLQNKSDKELDILKTTLEQDIDINNQKLQDAKDTNNSILESTLQLNAEKLNAQLEQFNVETQTETELKAFKKQLADEERAYSILQTQEKIAELLATGLAEDTEEARRLEAKLANDAKLKELEDQAKLDEEQRIKDITLAKETAETERLKILEDAKAEEKRIENQAKIDNDKLEEEKATKELEIKRDTANKIYDIQLKQFEAQKAMSLIQVAINTAEGISKAIAQGGILGLVTGAIVGGLGVAQAIAISTQPAPARPQLATGAYIPESQRGVDVTMGEAGSGGDIVLGMGNKGKAMRNKLIQETADEIQARGMMGGQTINLYANGIFTKRDLDDFAIKLRPSIVKANQRVGA